MINKLEIEFINKRLDIQLMLYLSQKPIKILENISRLCNHCFFLKGGNLINMIYSFLQHTSDLELQKVYLSLTERTFIPYIEILRNWVCTGYLDDCYEEFMIVSNPLFTKENIGEYYNELYWEKKFSLNKLNVSIII